MRLLINEDANSVSKKCAEYIAAKINDAHPTAETPFVMATPTGNTAKGVYAHLCTLFKTGKVSFEHVVTFNIDEYVALPRLNPNSQHSYMWDNFFRVVDIRRENVNFLDGNASDLDAECARYEAAIAASGGIDLAFFSTGRAGHVARNEPGSSLKSRTRPKTLDDDTMEQLAVRWARQPATAANGSGDGGGGGGGGSDMPVPKVTLTMGVGTLLESKEVVVLFSGSARARALEAALEFGVNHMFPVSAFQRHPRVLFLCDEDATLELRVKTVKYFEGLAKTTTFAAAEDTEPTSKRQKK
jgi:glucosamine-6-phosphate deaminase